GGGGGARGERGGGADAPGAGAHRLRGRRPAPLALGSELPQADRRALPADAVRAAPLLPVRPRGGVDGARVRERVPRSLAHDPVRLAPGRGAPRGARARAGLEAPLRLGRGAPARALPPPRPAPARGARRGAGGSGPPPGGPGG